jgi:nicotinamide mononucleotide transporter
MTWQELFEYIIVVLNLGFLFLMIRQNIWSWFLGGLGSALSIVVFIDTTLYSEAILYSFYVVMAVYGWWVWKHSGADSKKDFPITEWKPTNHVFWSLVSVLLSLSLGWLWSEYTEASYPFFDSATAVFSLLATYLEARKILSAWIYWFIINLASAGLYHLKGLDILALQMVFYAVMCIWGWREWEKAKSETF